MIWHDDIIVNGNIGIDGRDVLDGEINDLSQSGEMQFRRAAGSRPYGDGGENAALFVGADGDEIGAGGGVIVFRQADLFSLGQSHGAHTSDSSMRAIHESPLRGAEALVGAVHERPVFILPHAVQKRKGDAGEKTHISLSFFSVPKRKGQGTPCPKKCYKL